MTEQSSARQPRPPDPANSRPQPSRVEGCIVSVVLGILMFACIALAVAGVTLIGYFGVARVLPSPGELATRANQGQTTRIYDRDGQLLQAPLAPNDPTAGVRRRVSLDEISPYLIAATVATEDANFYNHRGIDPVALARAVFQALRTQAPIAGTSTISQQLVKLVFLSPERTVSRKLKEAVLAAEITRRYDKDRVLEFYLNEINYGNLAYGAEAASQVYFGKAASELTLAEASLLAGLPQSPATYDPLQNPEAARRRQSDVLRLMVQHGAITPEQADAAWLEALTYHGSGLESIRLEKAPHFVMVVRSQLEQLFGPEVAYRSGLQVYTSLDSELQDGAETAIRQGIDRLRHLNVSNGALVAIRPGTGEILAMVGSADFNDPEISGQVNVALAPRQPGSSIKPFTYLATFEQSEDWWTVATMIEDVRTEFDDGPGRPPYVPVNYDGKEHGWVSVRTALANSLNIPAVKALEHVGVDALLDVTDRFGIETLTRPGHPAYGLSLTLGGGDVTLLEMTGAYAGLATAGTWVAPSSILCILDAEGRVLEMLDVPELPETCRNAPFSSDARVMAAERRQAAAPQDAYLITDILKDNEARSSTFGPDSALRLDRPAAAKTGTSNDVRDGWTLGYTPELVAGVWVGNSSGAAMHQDLSGSQVAAPIWKQFMTNALASQPARGFPIPNGVVVSEVCSATGTVPDSSCPPELRRAEVFAAGKLPPGADPSRYQVLIAQPRDGQPVEGVVQIMGSAKIPDFDHYLVEYGESYSPGAWGLIAGPIREQIEGGQLAVWDTRPLPKDGPHVLRVAAVDRRGVRYESPAVRVDVIHPVPTRTPTPTLLPTATWTPIPTATWQWPTPWVTATLTSTVLPPLTETPGPPISTATPAVPTWTPTLQTPTETALLPTATPTSTPVVPTPTPTKTPVTASPTATQPLASPTLTNTPVLPTPTATPGATVTPVPTVTPPGPGSLVVSLDSPRNGETLSGDVSITGRAEGLAFLSYQLEYGLNDGWFAVDPGQPEILVPRAGELGVWDTTLVPNGPYMLKLTVRGINGQAATAIVGIVVQN
ncbi:MAG: transglycosylase domain-containing protein [Chloroflexota bacterium]|nr:transglycosylase domain-containing protein [Chloroflexota bacterium]